MFSGNLSVVEENIFLCGRRTNLLLIRYAYMLYICIYSSIYVYADTCIFVYMYVYICGDMYVRMHICMWHVEYYMYVCNVCANAWCIWRMYTLKKYIYVVYVVCLYVCCVCMCSLYVLHMYMCMCVCIFMCIDVCIYNCMCVCVYVCICIMYIYMWHVSVANSTVCNLSFFIVYHDNK